MVVLFVLRVVSWRDVERYVNWGVLLMYGGAIAFGAAINKSGAATWLAHMTISRWATSPVTVVALTSLVVASCSPKR